MRRPWTRCSLMLILVESCVSSNGSNVPSPPARPASQCFLDPSKNLLSRAGHRSPQITRIPTPLPENMLLYKLVYNTLLPLRKRKKQNRKLVRVSKEASPYIIESLYT